MGRMAKQSAVGFVETRGLVGVIAAADTAVKTAQVELIGFQQIGDGMVSVRFAGDVASVQVAVQAGAEAAERVSTVITHNVIPAPHRGLRSMVSVVAQSEGPDDAGREEAALPPSPGIAELQGLPVARLRQLVRQRPDATLQGRQVSRANRATLLEELKRLWSAEA
jgi:ethanolamine utilization protein EutM